MLSATLRYNWRYEWSGRVHWVLNQIIMGFCLGVGFSVGQWMLS